jgi:hypothetical protein
MPAGRPCTSRSRPTNAPRAAARANLKRISLLFAIKSSLKEGFQFSIKTQTKVKAIEDALDHGINGKRILAVLRYRNFRNLGRWQAGAGEGEAGFFLGEPKAGSSP